MIRRNSSNMLTVNTDNIPPRLIANKSCIICRLDDNGLILGKLCCETSYVCRECLKSLSDNNITNCPLCRQPLRLINKYDYEKNNRIVFCYIFISALYIFNVIAPVLYIKHNYFKEKISSRDVSKKGFQHYLLKEIYETRDIVESTLCRYIEHESHLEMLNV